MSKKRVLVVDDDDDILDSLSHLLEERYDVVSARNGVEALQRMDGVDAVILDMMMPVLDGEGVLAELARRGVKVPVLIMSARTDAPERARLLGAVGCLTKPFPMDRLEAQLARLLEGGGPRGPTATPPGSPAPPSSSPPHADDDPRAGPRARAAA